MFSRIFCCFLLLSALSARARPNVLWITCEDISPFLGCYGFEQAHTPNLDRLAAGGIRYTRAYANAPVCAVSRSTILTGIYATTLGTHPMRANAETPEGLVTYPEVLRAAGYYCTNNSKKDYNSDLNARTDIWDASSNRAHYRDRAPGQPFFAVFNIGVTHEGQLSRERIERYVEAGDIPPQPRIDPSDIRVPPFHPDLPEVREDWARFHDLITLMDQRVGDLLAELEASGEADNTIIFFYSDHGGMLAAMKRYIWERGTHIPLILYFPEKWKHLAPSGAGTTTDRLVSFVDFPVSLLRLLDLPVPDTMQGEAFLGKDFATPGDFEFFFRDRMGERPDFSRAVTDGRWYYIRNFMPHRPYGRDSRYGYWVQQNWRAWEDHHAAGKTGRLDSVFYQPKPAVELYDLEADPWSVNNLAEEAVHRGRVEAMGQTLQQWMEATRDLGLIPESLLSEWVRGVLGYPTLYAFSQSEQYHPDAYLPAALLGSTGDAGDLVALKALGEDPDPVKRFWGLYGIFRLRPALTESDWAPWLAHILENDPMATNRIAAAQALGACGEAEAAAASLKSELEATQDPYVFLYGLNALQYSGADRHWTRADLERWQQRLEPLTLHAWDYARRIVDDALELWPERRKVF